MIWVISKMKQLLFITVLLGFVSTAFCADFKDSLGRVITLNDPPGRIISLAPSLTEILYALGLSEKIMGVTNYSYYPPEASLKPKVGSYIDVNVEKIISLSPDLVIGTIDGNKPWVVDLLEQAGIQVFIVNPRNVQQVIETIATIGKVCGLSGKGIALSDQLQRRVDFIREKTGHLRKPVVFLQINIRPIMAVNKNTFHHDLIRLAGGINMTAHGPLNYPRISIEEVINRKPDVILISSMERGGEFDMARKEWLKWTSIPAVKSGRVYLINSDLIDRPSPRIIEGLEVMAKLIHPETFSLLPTSKR